MVGGHDVMIVVRVRVVGETMVVVGGLLVVTALEITGRVRIMVGGGDTVAR